MTTTYKIRIKGHLDQRWADWFGDLTLAHQPDGTTVMTGPVVDQAALYGILTKIHNLGMPLLEVYQFTEQTQTE